jgi:hypothetical protein
MRTSPKTRPQADRERAGFGWYFTPVCGEIAALSPHFGMFPHISFYFLIWKYKDFFFKRSSQFEVSEVADSHPDTSSLPWCRACR